MKRFFELIWVRIRKYFRHPLENLRQANPVVPGRLYSNFGYICKAVPYTREELEKVQNDNFRDDGLSQEIMLEQVKSIGIKNVDAIKAIQTEASNWQEEPVKCQLCDFAKKAIPCPHFNKLANGTEVCETHRYVIIKNI